MRVSRLLLPAYRLQGPLAPPPPPPPPPPPGNFGTHLGDYMRQPGDQILVMANGNYDGANINVLNSVHAATGGVYNGWLIIQAQTQGQVTVDLSTTGMPLVWDGVNNGFTHKQIRILFVGINFKFGMFVPEWVQYVRFYYCDWTVPINNWNTNQYVPAYTAKYGQPPAQGSTFDDSMGLANFVPSMTRQAFTDTIEYYFCNMHNIGDHLMFLNSCSNIKMQGCNAWDDFHHEINYFEAPLNSDIFHCGLLCQSSNITIHDCGIFFNFEADTNASGGGCTIDIRRFWSFGVYSQGMTLSEVTSGPTINGTIQGAALWGGNGQMPYAYGNGLPAYNSSFDLMFVYTDPGGGIHTDVGPANLKFLDASGNQYSSMGAMANATHYTSGNPSGFSQIAGVVNDWANAPSSPWPDLPTLVNHASNPANIDRAVAGHGPTDFLTYFSGNWP